MPIEFECRHCRQRIRVPDGSEGKRTRCFQCETVQPIPADGMIVAESPAVAGSPAVTDSPVVNRPENPFRDHSAENPYQSPQLEQPRTRAQLRVAAIERLRLPTIFCQVLLWLMLLATFVGGVFFVYLMMEIDGLNDQEDWIVAIILGGALFIQTILIVVALIGLGQAQKLGSIAWAWTGFIMTAFIGLNCMLMLPFAIWGMVVLGDHQVSAAFKTSAKKP